MRLRRCMSSDSPEPSRCCIDAFRTAQQVERHLQLPGLVDGVSNIDDSFTAAGQAGWGDVSHWLWPLFSGGWQEWRDALGLPPVPFLHAAASRPALPPPPHLLYGLSERVIPRPGYWPDSVQMCGTWTDRVLPVSTMYLKPMSICQRSQEERHCVSGPIEDDLQSARAYLVQAGADIDLTAVLGDAAAAFVRRSSGNLVCVDLGSMPRMGFVPDAASFVAGLCCALLAASLRGLLLTGGYQPLQLACRALAPDSPLAAASAVPHSALLPHCIAVVHHGGGGTTVAALRAGAPQLVCPLHFDQFQWAERVEHLGVGLRLPDAAALLRGTAGDGGASLAAQLPPLLAWLRRPGLEQQCRAIAADLRVEPDGMHVAVPLILQELRSQPPAAAGGLAAIGALLARHPQQSGAQLLGDAIDSGNASTMQQGWQEVELAPGFLVQSSCPDEAHFMYQEIFHRRCYLQHGISVGLSDIVLDAGANIGLFALFLLQSAKPPAHIYAVEPLPPNLALLRHNLLGHSRVTILPCGLGSVACSQNFTYYPNMPGNSTVKPAEKAALQSSMQPASRFSQQQAFECQLRTVSSIMRAHGLDQIDLLKIDCEGSELDVLLGIEAQHWPSVNQVVLEVHAVSEGGCSRVGTIRGLLQTKGLEVVCIAGEPVGNVLMHARRLK